MSRLKIDAHVPNVSHDVIEDAKKAERLGFDTVWTSETAHDAFLPHPLIAEHTHEIGMGTQIATAFTRSPMVLAYLSWDLQRFSKGRFILGLGTQVKGHNERRFSVDFEWEKPGPRFREEVRALKHIFEVFQDNTNLNFHGEFYDFSLMTDEFRPDPIKYSPPPIYIAGVNEYNIRTAGSLADGLCMHRFNTPKYTNEYIRPLVESAAKDAGRSIDDIELIAVPFVISGRTDEEWRKNKARVKRRLAFYGSTRTYHDVFKMHGFTNIGMNLYELSKEKSWKEMAGLIDDDILNTFSIEAEPSDLIDAVKEEYGEVVSRVTLPMEFSELIME